MKSLFALVMIGLPLVCPSSWANVADVEGSQGDYERSVEAVVRNKKFYKADKIEVAVNFGTMPYNSVFSEYMVGGRAAWHLSDHFGWEIIDAQMLLSSTSGFTSSLITGGSGAGPISDMEAVLPKLFLSSNLLVSPIYGKVRFFGAQVLYFDIYGVVGLGVAKTETHQFSTGTGNAVTDTVINSGMDPMGTLGLGFKLFLSNGVGAIIDLRDYISYSKVYGGSGAQNNFSVSLGVVLFLPFFG